MTSAVTKTQEKRALLRQLGAQAFHSRKVADFEEGILEEPIEIGKLGIWTKKQLKQMLKANAI